MLIVILELTMRARISINMNQRGRFVTELTSVEFGDIILLFIKYGDTFV